MRVHVGNRILGASGLTISTEPKKYSWASEAPADAWAFDLCIKPGKCFDTLLKINGATVDTSLPIKYRTMLAALHTNQMAVNLKHMLPKEEYEAYVKKIAGNIETIVPQLSTEYFIDVYDPASYLFDNLERCNIDRDKLAKYLEIEVNLNQVSALKTFEEPVAVTYDRFKARTGRLVTDEGPHMLLLRKEYRDVLVSRYEGGKIIYVDYSALESRIMLAKAGRKVGKKDLYQQIATHLFEDKITRAQSKQTVLSLLYGMNDVALSLQLEIQLQELRLLLDKLKKFFKHEELLEQIYSTSKDGYITNHFGRRIRQDETKEREINSFCQSTGVDVALLGFTAIVRHIHKQEMLIHPLFVLHDALILDVHPDEFERLDEVVEKGMTIPKFDCKFPIHVENINERQ